MVFKKCWIWFEMSSGAQNEILSGKALLLTVWKLFLEFCIFIASSSYDAITQIFNVKNTLIL